MSLWPCLCQEQRWWVDGSPVVRRAVRVWLLVARRVSKNPYHPSTRTFERPTCLIFLALG
eukprot:786248-Prymnesium_polylepis.2